MLNIILNLLPKGFLNPSIPSLAVGAALAAAVFRFDFLKEPPGSTEPALQQDIIAERRSQVVSSLIFGLMAVLIISAGYLSYINFKQNLFQQLDNQLSTLADLTASRLTNWRDERMGDAEILKQNTIFSALVQTCLENPSAEKAPEALRTWLDSLRQAYGYDRIFLVDMTGNERFASPDSPEKPAAHLVEDVKTALDSGKVLFLDFHRHDDESSDHLVLLVPLYKDPENRQPLVAVILRMNPADRFYPILQHQTGPNTSVKTLVVRKEKNSALFLNDPGFLQNLPFHPHIPLTETGHPAVRAVLGETGPVTGKDHQGRAVIAHIRPVPGSPWFLIVQTDRDESEAPVQKRLWRTLVFISLFLALPITGLILVLRQQRMRHFKERVKSLEAIHAREETLQSRESLLNKIIDILPVGIWVTDAQGRLIRSNKAGRNIWGAAPSIGEPIGNGRAFKARRLPSGLEINWNDWALTRTLRENVTVLDEMIEIDSFDGRKKTILNYSAPVLDGSGNIEAALAVNLDITKRKRAEDLIRMRMELLQFSDSHPLETVLVKALDQACEINQSPIGFYHFVENDQKTLSLQAWSTRTKQEFCQAKGKGMHYPIEKAGVWADSIHEKKPVIHNDYASLPNRKGLPEGHAPVIRELTVPILRNEKVVAIMGVGNKPADYTPEDVELLSYLADVSWEVAERVKSAEARQAYEQNLEETVRARTLELEAANRELEAFTYSVSHDLRAPLRHINGYIDLLANRFTDALPEKARHYLKNIVDSATEMGTLIDDLLHLSRTGRLEMHQTLFNMNDLFLETLRIVKHDYSERIIRWETARLPVVQGDPSLLKLVWLNLLDNAIKFSKKKECAKIETGFKEEEREYIFYVRDNGSGFDMKYGHKLFGVFQRLHSASEYEGTGIGLANVRRIILRHGGRTWAEAEPDKGAVFYFTLPR